MNKFQHLISIAFLLTSGSVAAQKEANHWYFGSDGAGLEFNNDCEVTVKNNGYFQGYEGVVTMSDKTTGELLFYSNSQVIMNSLHDTIPNSQLVTNGNTITQIAAVQKPGSESIYYIITSEIQAFSGEHLRFHALDMSLNNGLGGMLFTDSVLYDAPVTEKLCAVRHANGEDIWIVAHAYNSADYLAFLVTANGINTNAMVSSIGKLHGDPSYADAVGELKVSPDGSRLAAVTLMSPDIEVFHFNTTTGVVSDLLTLPAIAGYDGLNNPISNLYGLSFSPNSNLLYASQWLSSDSTAKILQYDLSSGDADQIAASRFAVYSSNEKNIYSLKLGPDGRIYVAQNQTLNYLGIIQLPDVPGSDCMYADEGINLGASHSGWGLNNLMDTEWTCAEQVGVDEKPIAESTFVVYPNPASDRVTIQLLEAVVPGTMVRISNATGQLVYATRNPAGKSVSLETGQLEEGIYIVEVSAPGRATISQKLIIQP